MFSFRFDTILPVIVSFEAALPAEESPFIHIRFRKQKRYEIAAEGCSADVPAAKMGGKLLPDGVLSMFGKQT